MTAAPAASDVADGLLAGQWSIVAATAAGKAVHVPAATRCSFSGGKYDIFDGSNDLYGTVAMRGSSVDLEGQSQTTNAVIPANLALESFLSGFVTGNASEQVTGARVVLTHDTDVLVLAREA